MTTYVGGRVEGMVPYIIGQSYFRIVVFMFEPFFVIIESVFEFSFCAAGIFCMFSVFVLYRGDKLYSLYNLYCKSENKQHRRGWD